MPRTVWYPGHMAKGRRRLEDLAANIDLLIEVRDARAPRLTSSPILPLFASRIKTVVVLSKADLAEERVTKLWREELKREGFASFALDLRSGGMQRISKSLLAEKPSFRDLRVAVVGIPNVGKSTLINQLVGRRAAPVGGIPGITKGVSWFSGSGFLLADSPGILDPHGDARAHRLMSWIGSSRGQVIGDIEEHAKECIAFLISKNLWRGVEGAWSVKACGTPFEILENIGRRLGKLKSGGVVDAEGAGRVFLDSFASGKFGRMSLEAPGDAPLWEEL
ncbi:YlqF/YawG family GTPase [Synergistes jonesii]|uniref:Ribosome biogenesis GTPase A n=2 Tax=Synergistes jonesii TaxID=2754 RepID=A0A073J4E2_9BACT|nr:GTPase [Synergistes jonesii]KEJ92567.1 ribosome biogenesis GTP-binding protein [Synergistes jonesii]OFB61734.1 ribosome biogenesis GTP-binding protein [Synergistes jonesii]OFB63227.1 ribosome biogenesis GTP-binding protein [Synergistes jonesii]OFB64099.1 ribosome biogenesis GTP-binding protein [Synergistes jonesii]OFB67933.1 ribosome biogenesis GTP-binding protein [Synergistes jonesii]